MKGADQCPSCASRKWGDFDQPVTDFYAAKLRCCGNCGTTWEPFKAEDLLDDDPLSCFVHPCDNCAFRKGSNEQKDPVAFAELRAKLDWNNGFYCHKGVPVDPASEYGFLYPAAGQDRSKLRLCRGYLNTLKPPKESADV